MRYPPPMRTDVAVDGAGLAGLVAACEAAEAGRSVVVLDQEPEQSLGGQAHWSLGGIFVVDSREQRRLGVRDSLTLARSDWFGSAAFDRPEDHWPRLWAEALLEFAAGEARSWLRQQGGRVFPIVGGAERGDLDAGGHGNSVPRFHLTWGTGPGVLAPFLRRAADLVDAGRLRFAFRHRVDELLVADGAVVGLQGAVLEPSDVPRGVASSRVEVGDFELHAGAVIVSSGGIGGNLDLVRAAWPQRLGVPPAFMVAGVPAHVDGRMLGIAEASGARLINGDRMWHYNEGLVNWNPVWTDHGIRILPGPSSLWLDGGGNRLPAPFFPGFDTLGTLAHLRGTGHDHSWFVLTQQVIEKEFALSGSEQNPDLTGKSIPLLLKRVLPGAPGPVEAFKKFGAGFVLASAVDELAEGIDRIAPEGLIEVEKLRALIVEHDVHALAENPSDPQQQAIRRAREYLGDKLIRVAPPHAFADPRYGPLIAVKLHTLTRKTLGGLETDLSARCLRPGGSVLTGLYAAGEAAGFGGGGMHGYNALEGTFLGGCLFSGRTAGRAAATQ